MRPACFLIDYFGCDAAALDDAGYLARVLQAWGGQVTRDGGHVYEPQGVSRVLVADNARLLLHTWPEHGSASLDIWSWGLAGNLQAFADYVGRELQAQAAETRAVDRRP